MYIVENTCTSSISKVKTEDQYHPQVYRLFEASLNHIQLCLKKQTNRDQEMVQQLRALIALLCKTNLISLITHIRWLTNVLARCKRFGVFVWPLRILYFVYTDTLTHTHTNNYLKKFLVSQHILYVLIFYIFKSYLFFFLFCVYQCFVSMYICTPCACKGPWKSEEDFRFPGPRIRDGVSHDEGTQN